MAKKSIEITAVCPGEEGSVEIERKFLVDAADIPDDLSQYPQYAILQGYIVADGSTAVRLRLKGSSCYITVKSGHGISRSEHEAEISRAAFDALWPATEGRRLEKIRYEIPGSAGLMFELDLYHGKLQGLSTVEAEFDSMHSAEQFTPPDWFGRDVTQDSRYGNYSLAVNGLATSESTPDP